jgi:hypothetical protein
LKKNISTKKRFNKNGEHHLKEQDEIFSVVYRLLSNFFAEHDKKLGESYKGKTPLFDWSIPENIKTQRQMSF